MLYQSIGNNNFAVDEYIKFYDFDNLYENFKNFMEMIDSKNNENHHSYNDKFLLATVVGCIEGNIQIDMKNNSWYIWLGQYKSSGILDSNQKSQYILLSIYEFIKNHLEFYDFIIKYYNLWHKSNKHEDHEFIYDKYHKQDIQENFQQLLNIINEDIKKARNIMDNYATEPYKILCGTLVSLFSNPKLNYR